MSANEPGQLVLEQLQRGPGSKIRRPERMEEERKDDDLEHRLVEAINISDRGFQAIAKKIIDLDNMAFST